MNPAEYTQLCSPRLSHAARTLYYLYLRRQADQDGCVLISYPELGRAIAVEDPLVPGGFRFQVTASGLTELFNELISAGLLELQTSAQRTGHYHHSRMNLPLIGSKQTALPVPSGASPMTLDWRPDREFETLSKLCGLRSAIYDEDELGEFIAYWLGYPEKYATAHQWMLKFIRTLKARRYNKNVQDQMMNKNLPTQAQSDEMKMQQGPSPRAKELIEQAAKFNSKSGGKDEL
jgi:hypothetical protein